MFVCICNALRDRDFKTAIQALDSIDSVEALYRYFGCEPQCGTCLDEVRARLAEGKSSVAAE